MFCSLARSEESHVWEGMSWFSVFDKFVSINNSSIPISSSVVWRVLYVRNWMQQQFFICFSWLTLYEKPLVSGIRDNWNKAFSGIREIAGRLNQDELNQFDTLRYSKEVFMLKNYRILSSSLKTMELQWTWL